MGHTPGPWEYDDERGTIYAYGDEVIVNVLATVENQAFETDETDANGQLMAAAPDLLGACQLIISLAESSMAVAGKFAAAFAVAMAAVDKATNP